MPTSDSISPSRHRSPRAGNGQKQRRRIVRRSNMSRSNTTPDLGIKSSATMYNGCGFTVVPDEAGLVNTSSSSSESFPSITNSTSFGPSPTASVGSGSSTIVEGKKKHGIFGFKAKDNDRPKSSHGSPLQLSPLPPLTPVKAAQFLGVEYGAVRNRSGSLGSRVPEVYEFNGLLVRSIPENKNLLTHLTNIQDSASEKTESVDGDVVSGPMTPKCFWAAGNRKAQRMLGLAPSRESSTKHGVEPENHITETPAILSKKGNRVDYSSEPDVHARPPAKPRKRRMRRKAPKSLDRMTPITEISCDELRSSYHDSEHNPELELISEYERDPSYSSSLPSRPPTPLPFTANTSYELEERDLSPKKFDSGKHAAAGAEEHAKKSDHEVGFDKSKQKSPAVIYLRGPLQSFEDCLLDATEANLKALMIKQNINDAARIYLDARGSSLRASHQAMKMKFVAVSPNVLAEDANNDMESESDDGKKLVSIRGSIDLEEDPIVDLAELMSCTHITPSAMKLIDVSPGEPKPTTPFKHKPASNSSSGVKTPLKPAYIFQHDEKASPFKELICNVRVRTPTPPLANQPNTTQPTLTRSHPPTKLPQKIRKTKKSKNLCNESRILVQNWISTNDHTKQRPLSDRLDIDVLSDQQIPPAPFPKDTNNISAASPTPPPRKSSKEHYCFRNGHILHPINLQSIPDEAAINTLEVRPYLRTHSGRKTHVHIPVFCDRCGEDVREELWECDIAVCRMVVCKACAADMEGEWRGRVCGEWKN
ncbi:hypothetical protein COCC4DRAFT_23617 [Bipolaris maydis ATCC 48331]|uniref:Uncharacterized protein n=1 Tax=Cochliobolus heterostrophus (strain C4 / ATCC 48331 / race T) TaxID=665024 RepID=N4XJ22_COCH4|nr:uncharacterized protein COCC4DRAFT_23617 [Bipolaris maydis ATCC 48331]KAJ5020616.1 hypothetical protein J3E73DRAFT_395375 [Bipolaris maydis]ENI05132.1 hypothetical protein COCC4DRAFT_23617 [Bipolaris maydis ATCC 48331]KAJ5024811.1 hypothetical protein J3E73DRAFT_193365 [Bipolaris maydis]KAJ6194437.1 hypothetical protein J3E72DRAFT_199002 [Bipolaris maydis]KAJ6212516.1 hypothetical protein PSV09DRAFT_2186409 [Bipolaris maydis]